MASRWKVYVPPYGQVAQEALIPDSQVNSWKPDAVLFALDYRALPLKLSLGDPAASAATVQGVIGYLQALRNGIKTNQNTVCIFQTFAPPVETLFGSLDRALPGTLRRLIDSVNHELAEFVLGSGDVHGTSKTAAAGLDSPAPSQCLHHRRARHLPQQDCQPDIPTARSMHPASQRAKDGTPL
jgi:hypothetical protein